jgi:hypothetical protein
MVDTFRHLLFDISKKLSAEEVSDLVFLCKVPQAAQTKIQDGKDLFKYLEESGTINEQKIHSLKKILYLLRPKRQDLLDLVEKKYPKDVDGSIPSIAFSTINTSINTITSSTTEYSQARLKTRPNSKPNSNVANGPQPQKKYFIVDCYCIKFDGCFITKPFCCCYGTTMLLLFLLTISAIFWFSGRPNTVYRYLSAEEYRKDIGFVVVGVLSFLLVIVIFPYLIRKHGPKIFSWCNKKRIDTMERRRSLRNERQLLRESQLPLTPTFIQPEKSPRNTAVELQADSSMDKRERKISVEKNVQRRGSEIQTI